MIGDHWVGLMGITSILGVLACEFLNDCSKFWSISSFDQHWAWDILDLHRFSLYFGGGTGILSFRLLMKTMVICELAHFHWYEKGLGGRDRFPCSYFLSLYRLCCQAIVVNGGLSKKNGGGRDKLEDNFRKMYRSKDPVWAEVNFWWH